MGWASPTFRISTQIRKVYGTAARFLWRCDNPHPWKRLPEFSAIWAYTPQEARNVALPTATASTTARFRHIDFKVTMKLSLVRPYLSLVDLPDQELPDFTLITGLNGAGKTHLMKALVSGAAVADIASDFSRDVRLFDWTSLTPRQEDSFSSEIIKQERIGFYTQIKNLYDQPWGWPQLFTHAISQGISGQLLTNPQDLVTATETELERFAQGSATAAQIRQSIDQAITQVVANIMGHLQPL